MAQRNRPLNQQQQSDQAITTQSSLTQVKTLVHAGIGCIAFLRGLFDEDSFEDAKLEAPRPVDTTTPLRSGKDKEKSEKPSTIRIKKLKKGGCESADKLLEWIELGVSDGIEKGYLHRLIFAIYLDPEDPTNLVESYTFTFTYETDDEGNRRAEMTVQDRMKGMILSSRPKEEIHKEGDVKRQVQQVIKNLLTSTQLLDELPRRRFFSLRALWYDETPDDYQPTGFKKISRFWPDYNLTTTSINDAPETSSLGSIETGYHGVSIHTVTISHVLETSFDDTITKDEATERNQGEAAARSVVWDAQTLVESVTDADDAMKIPQPLGVKNDQGQLVDIRTVVSKEEFVDLRKKVGIETDPEKGLLAKGLLGHESLIDSNVSENENLRRAFAATSNPAPTGGESTTQEDPVVNRQHSYKPPVPEFSETPTEHASRLAQNDNAFNAQGATEDASSEDVQMGSRSGKWTAAEKGKGVERRDDQFASPPAVESQLLEFSQHPQAESPDTIMNDSSSKLDAIEESDAIQTDSQIEPKSLAAGHKQVVSTREEQVVAPRKTPSRQATEDEACECGDSTYIGTMVCCTSCEAWRHNACYGYPEKTESVPEIFTCYRCQGHSAVARASLDDTREGEIEHALANLKSLALFRRAISLIWFVGVVDSKYFAQTLRIDKTTAAQVLKRLKLEKFIVEKQTPKNSRSKGVKTVAKKAELIVNKSEKQVEYKDSEYFSPGHGAEEPILAMLGSESDEDGADEGVTQDEQSKKDQAAPSSSPQLFDSRFTASPAQRQDASLKANVPQALVPATPSPVVVATPPTSVSAGPSNRFDRNKTLQTLEEEDQEGSDADGSSGLSDHSDEGTERFGDSASTAQNVSNKLENASTPRNGPSLAQGDILAIPKKPLMTGNPTASPSLALSNQRGNSSITAQISIEDEMDLDSNDVDSATPRAQITEEDRSTTIRPSTSLLPVTPAVPDHMPSSSMPNFPSKRAASPHEPEEEKEEEHTSVATQGIGGTANWRKVKKQKVSESEENLEAE